MRLRQTRKDKKLQELREKETTKQLKEIVKRESKRKRFDKNSVSAFIENKALTKGLITFKVTGRSTFPLDMLRYDQCWPYQPIDASKLQVSLKPSLMTTIELASYRRPSLAKWASYLWYVDEPSITRRD